MPAPNFLNFAFYHRLTRRERVLVLLVGGTAFLLLNLVALNVLARSSRTARQDLADKKAEWEGASYVLQDQPMWDQRRAWLQKNQPRLSDYSRAGSELLERIQGLARQHQVLLVRPPVIKPPPFNQTASRPTDYQSVAVSLETSSDWANLVQFMAGLQQKPEDFTAFEDARIQSNSEDRNTIKGTFTVAKWYAPAGK